MIFKECSHLLHARTLNAIRSCVSMSHGSVSPSALILWLTVGPVWDIVFNIAAKCLSSSLSGNAVTHHQEPSRRPPVTKNHPGGHDRQVFPIAGHDSGRGVQRGGWAGGLMGHSTGMTSTTAQ